MIFIKFTEIPLRRRRMQYNLIFSKSFQKQFATLDSMIQVRVLRVLESLKKNPFQLQNCKKLVRVQSGLYRVRVGDYRIRFDIEKKDVLLFAIRHRKDVYKR